MALAKDRACSYYGNMFDVLTPIQIPNLSSSSYGFEDQDEYQKQQMFQGGDHEHVFEATSYDQKSHSPPLSSSSSANSSSGFALHPSMYNHHHHHHHHQQQQQKQPQPRQQPQPHEVEAHSLINFKTGAGYGNFMQTSSGSLLSFQQADIDHHHNQRVISPHNYQHTSNNQPNPDHQFPMWEGSGGNSLVTHPFNKLKNTSSNLRMPEDVSHGLQSGNIYQDVGNDWLYDEAIITADSSHHHDTPPPPPPPPPKACFNKRPPMEDENPEALVKKQCTTNSRKTKPMSTSITKDPQSIAAKNRRERISERLKILQDLVPNGSKVDLVTMLEKAISYVKFLQLQVKVLAADEFWPAAGGKPPDISQVREAIDAILSSQQNDGATPTSTSTTSTK